MNVRVPMDRAPRIVSGPVVQDWLEHAACRGVDPSLWFPSSTADAQEARRICAGCPVQAECLAYALENVEQHGIWAGTNRSQRRAMGMGDQRYMAAECGTDAGYHRHRRTLGEDACEACLEAHAAAARKNGRTPPRWDHYGPCRCGAVAGEVCRAMKPGHPNSTVVRPHPGRELAERTAA